MPPTNVRRATSQPILLSRSVPSCTEKGPRREGRARRGSYLASEFERDVHAEFARRLIILLDRRRAGGDRARNDLLVGQVRSVDGDLPRIVEAGDCDAGVHQHHFLRSEEHTSELQSLMRISYAVFCLKKK